MQDRARARTTQPAGDASWEATYAGAPDPLALPWGTERLDADMAAWVDASRLPRGARALDIGTGPGTAAIHLARLGFQVTAFDISATAIAQAQRRAGALPIDWQVADVFQASFPQPFDLALDRGVFHVFPDELRGPYVERVAAWVRPKGYFLLKTFSDEEPPGWGPRRVSRLEVKRAFGPHFTEEAWQPSTFPGHATEVPHEPRAHLFVLRRR